MANLDCRCLGIGFEGRREPNFSEAQCCFSSHGQPSSQILKRLPPKKAAHIASIRDRGHQSSVLMAYILLELAVSAFSFPPPLRTLLWDKNGRPSFDGRPDIFFSLSHCDHAAACIAATYPVGIDVERLDQPLQDFEELAKMMGFQDVRSPVHFLALWTMWESYVKYSGGCPPPRNLRLLPEGPVFFLKEGETVLPAEFRLYRPTPTFLTAICMQRGAPAPSFSKSPQTIHKEISLL